jgi:hypothetical protein
MDARRDAPVRQALVTAGCRRRRGGVPVGAGHHHDLRPSRSPGSTRWPRGGRGRDGVCDDRQRHRPRRPRPVAPLRVRPPRDADGRPHHRRPAARPRRRAHRCRGRSGDRSRRRPGSGRRARAQHRHDHRRSAGRSRDPGPAGVPHLRRGSCLRAGRSGPQAVPDRRRLRRTRQPLLHRPRPGHHLAAPRRRPLTPGLVPVHRLHHRRRTVRAGIEPWCGRVHRRHEHRPVGARRWGPLSRDGQRRRDCRCPRPRGAVRAGGTSPDRSPSALALVRGRLLVANGGAASDPARWAVLAVSVDDGPGQ